MSPVSSPLSNSKALRVAVMSAYLTPLLHKHAQGECITYEDLQSSHTDATAALQHPQQPIQDSVSQELETLHQSQLQAYQAHAEQAIFQWFLRHLELPIPSSSTTNTHHDSSMSAFARYAKELMQDHSTWMPTSSSLSMPLYPILSSQHIQRIRQRAILQKAHTVFGQRGAHQNANENSPNPSVSSSDNSNNNNDSLSVSTTQSTKETVAVEENSHSMETIPEEQEAPPLAVNDSMKRKRLEDHDNDETEAKEIHHEQKTTQSINDTDDVDENAATTTSIESNQSVLSSSAKKSKTATRTKALPSSALATPPKKVLKKRKIVQPSNKNKTTTSTSSGGNQTKKPSPQDSNLASAVGKSSSSSATKTTTTSSAKNGKNKLMTGNKKQASKIPTLSKKTVAKKNNNSRTSNKAGSKSATAKQQAKLQTA